MLVLAVQYAGHDLAVTTKLALLGVGFVLSVVSYACFENPTSSAAEGSQMQPKRLLPTSNRAGR